MPVTTTDDEREAARLVQGGGRLLRHSHEMAMDLEAGSLPDWTAPVGVSLSDIDRPPAEIAAAAATATPVDHVDYATWGTMDRQAYWANLLAGKVSGPVVPSASRVVLDPADAVVGAVVVTQLARSDWWTGGAWLPELFVVPRFQQRGLGSLLLARALRVCRELGYKRIGLTVSEGNPAKALYEKFGFRPFLYRWSIDH